uniref:lymphocyte antigen 6K n=1 Tax=Odobenus rosmarus divergens TaxID=9708 RepID=UPI00063C3C9F|nr:PREDICTED: lymphocyte antigen 6K [Odobenus rosmarus divergens]
MTILLALLLVMDLPWVETDVTVSGKQGVTLRCHVCEIENSFNCTHETNCGEGVKFCSSVAVRIYPRFFYVSKQCSKYCPVGESLDLIVKSFVLLKPTPFLYVKCCSGMLCNREGPDLPEPGYRQGGSSSEAGGSSAWLVLFLTLSSGLWGLRLP